ncbi:MAG TPA: DUF3999 domain-containing protein [Steroidobacteraceae bacterium]|nr:DUF3999 domain-containing protein [Steroidobacteraceae bacterium]
MIRRAIGAAVLLFVTKPAPAAELSPADFAFGMPVIAAAGAAAYRATLPLGVYQGVVREDLADLRVFNARGEVVPYALSRPSAQAEPRGPGTALPLFALRNDSAAATDAVRVTIDSPNTAVRVQTGGSIAGTGPIKQYILDGRPLSAPVKALQLTWPVDAADFTGRLRVDASDDFAAWRTLAEASPIANLHANGQQLVNNRVELAATQAKYWRLSWIGKSAPFEVTKVVAEPADSRIESERTTLEVAGSAPAGTRGEYQFDLGARLPIDRINLALPELNSVVSVEFSSRAHPQDAWRRVAGGQFYRVTTADGELRNGPMDIGTDSDRYWLARAANFSGASSANPPHLQVSWTPSEVVFLARGEGPFMLAYGSAMAPSAQTDLSPMPSAVMVAHAALGAPLQLGGQARLAAPPAAISWKRPLLWAVLGLCVCLLAWMAYRLSQEMGENAPR